MKDLDKFANQSQTLSGTGHLTEFSPLDPAFISNPYETYKKLRQFDPVHQASAGYWVLTRYDDIVSALKDHRLTNVPPPYSVLNKNNRDRFIAADIANNIFPYLEPPKHAQSRLLISKVFFAQIKRRPPPILLIAGQFLEKVRVMRKFDVVEDFATPFSMSVICDVLGVPSDNHPRLRKPSKNFFYLFNMKTSRLALKPIELALEEFRNYFRIIINERKRSPENDFISALIHVADQDIKLDESEIIDTCMLLFSDGVENVTAAIANSIVALLHHPEEFRLLQKQPHLTDTAVDECLRFESPSQFISRIALQDINISGKTIPKGSVVVLALASANRDGNRFSKPDQLDITRPDNPHLSFGRGRHICLGAKLARSEMEIGLNLLVNNLQPEQPGLDSLKWVISIGHRWPERLELTI